MELWFIYALLSTVGAGIFTFFFKVAAEQKLQGNCLTGVYFFFSVCGATLLWVANGAGVEQLGIVWFYAAAAGILFSLLYVAQIKAFSYIDSTIFLPLYKLVGPLLVVLSATVILGEQLGAWQWFGVGLSLVVPLLLLQKQEQSRQRNLRMGLLLVVGSALCVAVATSFQKVAMDAGVSVFLFIMIQNSFGLATNVVIGLVRRNITMAHWRDRRYLYYGFFLGMLQVCFFALGLLGFAAGKLALVYSIMSLYIVIPIALSVYVYHEHINTRKVIAIVLSVVALVFFQI